jgi:hypothetical protein
LSDIEVYAFEDRDGNESGSFTTTDIDAAKKHAREHGLRLMARIYKYADSEMVEDNTVPAEGKTTFDIKVVRRTAEKRLVVAEASFEVEADSIEEARSLALTLAEDSDDFVEISADDECLEDETTYETPDLKTILVNGLIRVVPAGEITYWAVVALAGGLTTPTVTYDRGELPRYMGTLSAGEWVAVREGMIFNAWSKGSA